MTQTKKRKRRSSSMKRLPRGPHGGVELLLIQHVENLGRQGDVVEVRPGYAYNFLIPQGFATIATDHHKRMVEKHKAQLAALQEERLSGLRELKNRLAEQSITIAANANLETRHLYGSVQAPDIADELARQNLEIRADQIRLQGPLKELGMYTVKIHLGFDIDAELSVWVVPTTSPEGGEAPAAPPEEE